MLKYSLALNLILGLSLTYLIFSHQEDIAALQVEKETLAERNDKLMDKLISYEKKSRDAFGH